MSRDVGKADKLLRIVGFSIYLSLVISAISLFFRNLDFTARLFLGSLVYFILIFTALTLTNNIHFNVLLSRKFLEKAKAFCKSRFHLAKLRHFRMLFAFIIAFLAFAAIAYFSKADYGLAMVVLILSIFTCFYFLVHKISVYAIKEGIAFDYGEFIVLFKWKELKKYEIRKNHIILHLKEKNIQRGFYVDNPGQFEKVLRKFIG